MADDAVSGLMAALKKNGTEYLRFEMADMAGVSRSKTVPVDKVESYARNGLNFYGGVLGLDTGCIWGGKLTALRLRDHKLLQIDCEQHQKPGDA